MKFEIFAKIALTCCGLSVVFLLLALLTIIVHELSK